MTQAHPHTHTEAMNFSRFPFEWRHIVLCLRVFEIRRQNIRIERQREGLKKKENKRANADANC